MLNKNYRRILFFLFVFFMQHLCWSQDTLSKMTFYGNRDRYQKVIDREFKKLNKRYRTGIKHGLYYVYDIKDTNNKMTSEQDTLLFVNEHIYHVASPSVYGKVSMIIIPFNGSIFAFIGLNCCRKKHNIEDVVHWVGKNMQDIDYSTIEKIRRYYTFHPNIPIDPQGRVPKCEYKCYGFPIHKTNNYRKPKRIYSQADTCGKEKQNEE